MVCIILVLLEFFIICCVLNFLLFYMLNCRVEDLIVWIGSFIVYCLYGILFIIKVGMLKSLFLSFFIFWNFCLILIGQKKYDFDGQVDFVVLGVGGIGVLCQFIIGRLFFCYKLLFFFCKKGGQMYFRIFLFIFVGMYFDI